MFTLRTLLRPYHLLSIASLTAFVLILNYGHESKTQTPPTSVKTLLSLPTD